MSNILCVVGYVGSSPTWGAKNFLNKGLKEMEPRYEHDCDECIFLGHHNKYDLYVCVNLENEIFNTTIARYGKDGNYFSGIEFRDYRPALGEAFKRACEKGFLNANDYPKIIRCDCGLLVAENQSCSICNL